MNTGRSIDSLENHAKFMLKELEDIAVLLLQKDGALQKLQKPDSSIDT